MARIRTIKPEFPQSESMGRISRESRLCFVLLWTLADDVGRLRGSSRMLASLLYPYDDDAPKRIDSWLSELVKEKCILRYSIGQDAYIQIENWLKHQKIDKPSKSKIPSFDESSRILANPREASCEDQGSKDLRIKDQGSEDLSCASSCEQLSADAPPKPFKPSKLKITPNGTGWINITDEHYKIWGEAYPAINLKAELSAALAWLKANPKNTKSNYEKFLTNWFKRAQDKSPRRQTYVPGSSEI